MHSMSISQETIESIRERTNIADLISETVQLKRSGRGLVGLCPFHAEKSPSFSVNNEEGFYHCFGCQKHGSVFDFVMETRGLTFVEAVKFLGSRIGIEVQSESAERSEARKREEEERKKLRGVMREAVALYQERLNDERLGILPRRYLEDRGVNQESTKLFLVGYSPELANGSEELVSRMVSKLSLEREAAAKALIEVGLLSRRDDGSFYETFRGRLIFPILRSDGVPIALGGRILEANANRPKYINSKESPIYLKRQTLYGLHSALPYLRREREALLVEGYMDVIALAQAGFPSAIATCGTSVTSEHVQLLRRFCEKLVVVFDADSAGQKAAASCFELFLNSGIEVFGLSLPDGEDPGSFLIGPRALQNGFINVQREFDSLLNSSRLPILSVYLNYFLSQTDRGPAALGRLSSEFVSLIRKVRNPVEREANLKAGAEILGVSYDSLVKLDRSSLTQVSPRQSAPAVKQNAFPKPVVKPQQQAPKKENDFVKRKLGNYLEQMLVSVICEPSLSETLLQMQDSLRQVSNDEFPLNRLEKILRTISTNDFVALENYRERQKTPEFAECLGRWKRILDGEGLDSRRLLSQAWDQVKIGGAQPGKIVQEANKVFSELSLRSQMEKLKHLQRNGSSEEDKSQLAQRRLLERRNLKNALNREDVG